MISYSLSGLDVLKVLLGLFLIFRFYKPNKKAPPGPTGIPIFGNILQIGSNPIETLKRWSKEYGSIFSLNILTTKVVFVNDIKLIREMMSQSAFTGKAQNHMFTLFSKGPWGVLSTEGKTWEEHRRFTLRGLRDFGFSKSAMEGLIAEEVVEVLDWFKENDGKRVSVQHVFNIGVSNSLWTIINGKRNKQNDSEIEEMLSEFLRGLTITFQRGLYALPWLRYIIPNWSGYNVYKNSVDQLHEFVGKAIDEHKKHFVPDNPRDFIDLYLEEIRKAEPGSPFYKEVGEKHMIGSIVDLFIAGNETTSTTLTWAMLYLAHHPEVQESMRKEIDSIVGTGRQPLLSDRPNMPYIESVVMEVLRKSTLIPLGVPHRALRDEKCGEFLIQKDTLILPHLQYVMNNPDIWGDPEAFRPERFLNEGRNKVVKNENLIPFQVGKRQCLGEGLARDTLFLFLASIFHEFEVLHDPENPKPDFSPQMALVNTPPPFKVVLRRRRN